MLWGGVAVSMSWPVFLMYLWGRSGSGVILFCVLARTIWNPATVRYPKEVGAVQEVLC